MLLWRCIDIRHRKFYLYTSKINWSRSIGVQDLVIVETDDAVMVAAKDRVQDVKDIVAQLKGKAAVKPIFTEKSTGPGGIMIWLIAANVTRPKDCG